MPPLRVRTEDEAALLLGQSQRSLQAGLPGADDRTAQALVARFAALASLIRAINLLRPNAGDPTWATAAREVALLRQHLRTAADTVALGSNAPTPGYEPALVRRVSGNAPPRLLPRLTRAAAYEELLSNAEHLEAVCAMTAATSWTEVTVRPSESTRLHKSAAGLTGTRLPCVHCRRQRMMEHLLGGAKGPSIFVRSQLKLMLVGSPAAEAKLWHRHSLAREHLPAELLEFSRTTWATMPPETPKGGMSALPENLAEAVGHFLQTAAQVRFQQQ